MQSSGRRIARMAVAAVVGSCPLAILLVACSTTSSGTSAICGAGWDGCSCHVEPWSRAPPPPSACSPTAFPGTSCCADPGWPSTSATCACNTGDIYCGILSGYFTDGTAGCVCSPYPHSATEKPGATCYPGASTTLATLGICCMFPTGDCACGAGLHTCGNGGSPMSTCSAANFPAPTHACTAGKTLVASCSESGVGALSDSGNSAAYDASPFGTCASNMDCDPMYQFCKKTSCDRAASGTCATRPGLRVTFYCSPDDGGGTVCGCDGQTWSYACIANAQGINVASDGPCLFADAGGD